MKIVTYIISVLKSRTVWAILALVIVNGVQSVTDMIPAGWLPMVDAALGLLAVFFRIKPKQKY